MSPMLPPPAEAPAPIPVQQTGYPVSPSSEQAPPPEIDPNEARKIAAATGRGFRRDTAPVTEHESGEPITLRGANGLPTDCKYCHVTPCRGISWIFEGEVRFKCDACGKKQKLGYVQEVSDRVHSELEGYQRADTNRRKLWREEDAQREEERKQQLDNLVSNPDSPYYSAINNRGFVDSTFFG